MKLAIISLHFEMASVSSDSISSLQQLPTEILFRIFDDLDALTLLFSLARTSRRLRTLVHSYDRLSVDFTFLSKPQFHCLLNVINPHNVTSLTLAHHPETRYVVDIFCSYYRRRPFDRLRSLTLCRILEKELQSILECVQPMSLTCFTLKTDDRINFENTDASTVINAVSSMISRSSVCRLEMDIHRQEFAAIRWPKTNTIKQFRFNGGLEINQLSNILHQLPNLKILWLSDITKNSWTNEIKVERATEPFRQLTSLTLDDCHQLVDDLEYVLSLTSSLTHFKLVSTICYEDGKRWGEFIQLNLPHLTKFDFFFTTNGFEPYLVSGVESVVSSFRTPFWLEQKKWIVRHRVMNCPHGGPCLTLFSLPICLDRYSGAWEWQKDFIPLALSDDTSWMDNITSMNWCTNSSAFTANEGKVRMK